MDIALTSQTPWNSAEDPPPPLQVPGWHAENRCFRRTRQWARSLRTSCLGVGRRVERILIQIQLMVGFPLLWLRIIWTQEWKTLVPIMPKTRLTKLMICLKNTLSSVKSSSTPRIAAFSKRCFHRVRNTTAAKEVHLYYDTHQGI